MSDPQGAAPDKTAPELLPKPSDVRGAAERLAGHAVETPLLRADALDEQIGGRLLLKAEPLQRTGSFKFRGACNRLLQLDPAAKARGVVTYSSGNHAQAVAAAAKLVGVPAVIVMPRDAPEVKIAGTRRHGAEIVLYDRASEAREALGKKIAEERGAVLVKPYDDFQCHRRPGDGGARNRQAMRSARLPARCGGRAGGRRRVDGRHVARHRRCLAGDPPSHRRTAGLR